MRNERQLDLNYCYCLAGRGMEVENCPEFSYGAIS
jgi:hypothetical protein